jgi:hypothetical protein
LNDVLANGPVPASQVKEEAEDVGISERTLARGKKVVGVITYREGESGGRGKGQWFWKLPVVDLVDEEIKDATELIKDAKGCQNKDGGILNHRGGVEEAENPIDKPNSLRMPTTGDEPIKDANSIKDARVPTLENGGTLNQSGSKSIKNANRGTLKECTHGYSGGKGCYLCDPNHPYRKKEGVA